MPWLKRYWPWLVALFWLGGYELYALFTRIDGVDLYRPPTLSQMVWHATEVFPALPYIVVAIVVVLCIHFWIRRKKVQP